MQFIKHVCARCARLRSCNAGGREWQNYAETKSLLEILEWITVDLPGAVQLLHTRLRVPFAASMHD